MSLAIHELARGKRVAKEAVDEFLAAHAFPLVEGPCVTFVYRGMADSVLLQHFIYGLPTSQPFKRVDGTDLWYLVLELPARSRVEYKIDVVKGQDHNWIRDPLNSNMARDPFGANSVAYGAGYAEINARLPAQYILLAVAALAGILLLANVWVRTWKLLLGAFAVWV